MERALKEQYVYRIISGETYLEEYDLKIVHQEPSLKYRAACIYQQVIEQFRFEDWPTHKDCLDILIEQGLCYKDVDESIKALEGRLEELKIALYNSFFDKTKFDETTKLLSLLKKKYGEILDLRHSLDHLTLYGYAEMIRQQFLLYSTLYTMDNEKYWKNPSEVDGTFLDGVMQCVRQNCISHSTIRELARTDPWRSYWNINKDPFGNKIGQLTEDQKCIVMFSQMYDNIHEHPKCPPDEILNNDDALDGWLSVQRQEREQDKKEALLEGQFGHIKDANEVFLPGRTKEDREKIDSMNNLESKIAKQQRAKMIQQKGSVKDADFTDLQIDLQKQSNQQFMNTVRGK